MAIYKQTNKPNRSKQITITAIVFALIGIALLTISRAASNSVSVEPNTGTKPDSTAFNGNYLEFNGTTTPPPPPPDGKYTAEQIVDSMGMVKTGPYNPNYRAPWGLHDAPIKLPQSWGFAQGPYATGSWQKIGASNLDHIEWRGAVFAQNNTTPAGGVKVQIRNAAYYAWTNGNWTLHYKPNLKASGNGAYLVGAGGNGDPFSGTNLGVIPWVQISPGVFEAPYRGTQAMHFWAGLKQAMVPGQTAELSTAEIRLVPENGGTLDLQNNRLLAQVAVDYYPDPQTNNNKAPGPGIGKYQLLTGEWKPMLWATTPPGTAQTYDATVNWLNANPPPVLAQ